MSETTCPHCGAPARLIGLTFAQRLGLAEGLLQEIADDSIDPNGNIGHWIMNPAYLVGLRERISNILATEPTREEKGEG